MSDTSFDGQGITAGTELILSLPAPLPPASLFTPTPEAARRVLEFFTAQINNDHTRRAYLSAARRFDAWCEGRGLVQLTDVQAFHVAAFIKDLQGACSPPTVKQHLAALRMLFDWLVTGHVLEVNPAHAVRGPKYVVRKGKTPVLTAGEARELLGSIGTVRTTKRRDGRDSLSYAQRRPGREPRRHFIRNSHLLASSCKRSTKAGARTPATLLILRWTGPEPRESAQSAIR